MQRLVNKVALVTGGGTGIGRACALQFAREGAKVAIAGRRAEPLAAVAGEISAAGGEALPVPCDATVAAEVERTMQAVVERFGRLDALVNNAGGVVFATALETSEQEFDRMIAVNLKTTFLMSRAAVTHMRKSGGGAIVNIGSILGLIAMRNRAAYCAAKGGVTLLTKAMALDHAREGIRVNCICPSIVDTELVQSLFSSQPDPEAARRSRAEGLPLGRFGQPEDVANLAVYLASDESSWMTGAALPLDGGLSAY